VAQVRGYRMKYDQSTIDNTLDEAIMLYRQGKSTKGSHYATLAIAMMMYNAPAYMHTDE
jgi:hypothetical protein